MTHTPGPWTLRVETTDYDKNFSEHGDGVRAIHAHGNNGALMSSTKYYPWTPDNIDDWRLMAAAPDLLAALKAIVAMLQKEAPGTKLNGRAFDQLGIDAHNAIAKAEGR